MSTLTVGILQQPIIWMDGEANLDYFSRLIAQSSHHDLWVLPEMFTTGFSMQAATHSLSETRVLDWLQTLARKHNRQCGDPAN